MANSPVGRLFFVWTIVAAAAVAQNSTRKIRSEPSEIAARAGSAVDWLDDLEEGLAESAARGAPVFWYVPTVAGSPMDRKTEIDRYMMGGPFSHPDVVALLNAGFVPVRWRADRAAVRRFGLERGTFIEPGFLVLDRNGAERARAHRITTMHPEWFLARLVPFAVAVPPVRDQPALVQDAWRKFAACDYGGALTRLQRLDGEVLSGSERAEVAFLTGAAHHRAGRGDLAVEVWRRAGEAHPDEPWAWKCAAEAEGHGPFARGFEIFRALPPAVLAPGPVTTRAVDGFYDERALRQRGLQFLIAMQLPDGSYRDSWYDFGGTDGLPNVFVAVTSIAAVAMLEELATEDCPADREAVEAALQRALAYVRDTGSVNVADRDELVWAHAYRVALLARWIELRPDDRDRLMPALEQIASDLQGMATRSGAWFHEYENPFATATVLIALHAAQGVGLEVDRERIDAGVVALLACRAQTGAYSYGQGGRRGPSVAAAAGRMPLCELALFLWRGAEVADLDRALAAAFEHHEQLESVRKYDDHANALGYGGFFFWYDMLGRTQAIAAAPTSEAAAERRAAQHALILTLPEFDGCFVDSHELGRVYGTGMALWCLAILRRA